MSVFDDKNKKSKLNFPDDESIDTEQAPKNLEELNKSGRGASTKAKKSSGRPKLAESESQTKHGVMLYLTEEQKNKLREKAKKANLPMSHYIMVKLFGID